MERHVLTTTFVKPFDRVMDNDRLYNPVSGSPVNEDIAQNLLFVSETGVDLLQALRSKLHSSNKHNALKFLVPYRKMPI